MPIHKVKSKGKTGYKFGKSGKTYYGKSGKSKAKKQMRAMFANGYKGSFHESRFEILYNLVMESLNQKYENMTLAIVPGSFKPPHKGHWEMIMKYVNEVDKVVVLISNISSSAISNRPLSLTNLKQLGKLNDEFQKIKNSISNGDDNLDEQKEILDDLISKSNELSFDELKNGLEQILSMNSIDSLEYSKFLENIKKYLEKLNGTLFKSIRKDSNGNEITPEKSKEIFEIFAKAYHIEDKVDIIISDSASPITATYTLIEDNCFNCKIFLGVSKKEGDDSRWNNFKNSEENSSNEVIPMAVDVNTMLSATDLRNSINDLKKEWFPDELSDKDFEQIKNILNN